MRLLSLAGAACGGRVDRVRFVTHQGKQILFIDMTNCVSEEVMVIASEVQRIVTAQPRNSVLTLSETSRAESSGATRSSE